MANLFTPLSIRDVTCAHRAWMSPMMQFAAVPDGPATGAPTDWHPALVMLAATAVHPQGRSSEYDLGLWNDTQAEAMRRITCFVSAQGAVPGIQLVHAGRKGSTGRPWPDPDRTETHRDTVGASAVPFGQRPSPTELSVDEIGSIVDAFGDAAQRAADASRSRSSGWI